MSKKIAVSSSSSNHFQSALSFRAQFSMQTITSGQSVSLSLSFSFFVTLWNRFIYIKAQRQLKWTAEQPKTTEILVCSNGSVKLNCLCACVCTSNPMIYCSRRSVENVAFFDCMLALSLSLFFTRLLSFWLSAMICCCSCIWRWCCRCCCWPCVLCALCLVTPVVLWFARILDIHFSDKHRRDSVLLLLLLPLLWSLLCMRPMKFVVVFTLSSVLTSVIR